MCNYVETFVPGVPCEITLIAGLFLIVLLMGIFYLLVRGQDNGVETVDTGLPIESSDEPIEVEESEEDPEEASADEEEEETSDYYTFEISLTLGDGTLVLVYCDYIGTMNFNAGTMIFTWENLGIIEIEDEEGNTLHEFNSDDEPIEWRRENVVSWEIQGS